MDDIKNIHSSEKCPACGAKLPSFSLKCPECGYTFSRESDSSKEIRDIIQELQQMLLAAKNDRDRATIINTFSVPNTKESLMNLLIFSSNQFHSVNGMEEVAISSAWLNKAKQAFSLLKIQSAGDKETLEQLRQYAYLENSKTQARQSERIRKKKKWIRVIAIMLTVFFVIYLILLIISNSDTEEQPQDVRGTVMELIEEGRYEEARIKASEAEYRWEERELLDLIEKTENN